MIQRDQETCSILIVENSDDIRAGLANELNGLGHSVTVAAERDEALAMENRDQFALLVSDLVHIEPTAESEIVRSFKISVTSPQALCAGSGLNDIIVRTLAFKLRRIDNEKKAMAVREKIDLELPSDLRL